MDTATRVQILDYTVCISHSADISGKGMNPTILLPSMGKIVGHSDLFSLGMATDLEAKLLNQTY